MIDTIGVSREWQTDDNEILIKRWNTEVDAKVEFALRCKHTQSEWGKAKSRSAGQVNFNCAFKLYYVSDSLASPNRQIKLINWSYSFRLVQCTMYVVASVLKRFLHTPQPLATSIYKKLKCMRVIVRPLILIE